MNSKLNFSFKFFGNCQKLDIVPKLFGKKYILFCDTFYSFYEYIFGFCIYSVCYRSQYQKFVAGVKSAYIKSRVSFCISKLLGLFQNFIKAYTLFYHFCKHIVTSTVKNSFYREYPVCAESFSKSFNNRDTSRNTSFKPKTFALG